METLEQTLLLKRYSKRIKAARVIVFVLAGVCLLLALFGLIVGLYTGVDQDSGPAIYGFGGYGLFYLIVGLVSLKRPLWCYAITAGLHACAFLFIAATTHKSLYNDTYMATCFTIVFLILTR